MIPLLDLIPNPVRVNVDLRVKIGYTCTVDYRFVKCDTLMTRVVNATSRSSGLLPRPLGCYSLIYLYTRPNIETSK